MKRLLTHGTALAAGICLAWCAAAWRHGGPADGDAPAGRQTPPRRISPANGDDSHGAGRTGGGGLSPKDYQAAWDAIAHRPVTEEERQALQRVVIEAWAHTDLRGAMRAAAFSDPGSSFFARYPVSNFSAADALSGEFSRDPETAWAILQEQEFRFNREGFYNTFSGAVAGNMPVLAAMLPRMPQRLRMAVVENIALRSTGKNALPHAEVMRLLSSLPDAVQSRELVRRFASTQIELEPPETLLQRVTDATTAAERMVAEEAYFRTMTDSPEGTLMERWRALPEEARGRAVEVVVGSAGSNDSLPKIIGMIRESGRNDLLQNKSLTMNLRSWARNWEKDDVAEGLAWAASLPAVPEMDAAFEQTITGYSDYRTGELREWIGTLAAGWHRDRALAVYAGSSEVEEEDKAWARGQIADPEVRKRLEEE
ncbi:hypothetical protein OVA24_16330 [Luteolibacter sp. SL250]|uniref:hypothetical protein n=1 Tax=Luteolibacter sp. SL250 TaxID=2995170 RepID=UPI00226F961B|nr:hypothetical protein [Luteolibacter sp. SL250]WAC18798.1 hypothetical protein OVA24_16330 [Luteolibacter sp. SL250]